MRLWKYIYFIWASNICAEICLFAYLRNDSDFWLKVCNRTWNPMNDYSAKATRLINWE